MIPFRLPEENTWSYVVGVRNNSLGFSLSGPPYPHLSYLILVYTIGKIVGVYLYVTYTYYKSAAAETKFGLMQTH